MPSRTARIVKEELERHDPFARGRRPRIVWTAHLEGGPRAGSSLQFDTRRGARAWCELMGYEWNAKEA